MKQGVPFHLSPVGSGKAGGGLTLDQQGPLMLMASMPQQR
jgi:hypothetical protein